MKRIALLLLLAGACKTTDSQPTPQPAPSEPTPTVRSARPAPALPAAPAPIAEGSDRPQLPSGDQGWGHRGDRFARMDKDGDGKISDEERAAAMKERTERMRQRLDTNGDGKLTPDELAGANGKGRMHFDDPGALDTNHDGDISADELQAGMEAKREQFREQRMKARAVAGSGAATGPQ
jgi:Ca2+-binding EF-hand superfamily protein